MDPKSLRTLLLIIFTILFALPAVSTSGTDWVTRYESQEDSMECLINISIYREFYKIDLYKDAIGPWRKVFNECPSTSERMYVEGVQMYRKFIEEAPEGPEREALIDTLMLIYDRRMEHFGGEGNVLGRKGRDLLNYRRNDMDQVYQAYEMLKRSIELDQKESTDAVMILFISASISLNKAGKIDDNQAIEDYFMVTGLLDQLVGKSSRWDRAKATIDENELNSGILTCEALNRYYEPIFEQNQENKEFLEKVITFYTASGCDRSDIYVAASEKLYQIEPGPESAHNLAILFIAKNDYQKAAGYLEEAVQGEEIDPATKALWYYELAVVSSANGEYCKAIENAREAIDLKSDYGKAYIILGDAFIASRENLGDDFQERTAFWAAADMYTRAASVDPSVADEARRKLNDYASQYPDREDIFFRDMNEGDSYRVAGCINQTTTVRGRK